MLTGESAKEREEGLVAVVGEDEAETIGDIVEVVASPSSIACAADRKMNPKHTGTTVDERATKTKTRRTKRPTQRQD